MGKSRDVRGPRRRAFDDDAFSPRDMPGTRPARLFSQGGPGRDAPMAEGPALDATVKWFNGEKGFGFAELLDGTGDVFLHIGVLQAAGHESVAPGCRLKVNVGQGAKGRQITRVIEVDDSNAGAAAAGPPPPRRGPMRGPIGGGAPRGAPSAPSGPSVELSGSVKWFNPEKGFGFIAGEDGGRDVFIHISVLERSGANSLGEGQRVTMSVVETPKGREAIAIALD